jgi:hypothetical protein
VSVSVSSFVPKPFTPFQWEAQDSVALLAEKQRYLKDRLKMKYVAYHWHDAKASFLEAVFARGDAAAGEALYEAWKMGCRFDGWSEFFNFDTWMAAFEKAGADPAFYANRRWDEEEPLPWDILDYGVEKSCLRRERKKGYAGLLTENCRKSCAGCGVDRLFTCACKEGLQKAAAEA